MESEMRLPRFPILLCLAALVFVAASQAARFLVVDAPEKSDAIVVLAGETSVRPARAIELLHKGVAPHVFLDAESGEQIYDQRLTDIAQKYVSDLGETSRVSVCPIAGLLYDRGSQRRKPLSAGDGSAPRVDSDV